jgi:hypothetical protein
MELAALTGTAAHVIPETGEVGTALNPNRVRWTVDGLEAWRPLREHSYASRYFTRVGL